MIEKLIRTYTPALQHAYELMPYPVRNVLISARGYFLSGVRYSPAMYEQLKELRSHEVWGSDEIKRYQLEAIRRAVDFAIDKVPFYGKYPRIQFSDAADLSALPVLSREDLRANWDDLINSGIRPRDRIQVTTTGSTGAALKVGYHRSTARSTWAFRMRQWVWAGVKPRDQRITLFGSRIVPSARRRPPFWAYNVTERQILLSIFHLSENTARSYFSFLQKHQGLILEGFPSVLGILADLMIEKGISLPMRVVFTDGEPLHDFLRIKIEKAFQTRVYDSYGTTEFAGMLQECEHRNMHLIPEYAHLEILDKNDKPVPPGEEGYFVWTNFQNPTMPLLRYRIGDRGSWGASDNCECGRKFPLVKPTITRESDLLHCPDGRILSPRTVNQLLKAATSFRFCQFVQETSSRVAIRAVSNGTGAKEELGRIRLRLQDLLGSQMTVTDEIAKEPITRPGGKIPLIVNLVQQ